jgi:hypothetical protein
MSRAARSTTTTKSSMSVGDLNPAWLTFFREARLLAALAQQRRAKREAQDEGDNADIGAILGQSRGVPLNPPLPSVKKISTASKIKTKARRKIAV